MKKQSRFLAKTHVAVPNESVLIKHEIHLHKPMCWTESTIIKAQLLSIEIGFLLFFKLKEFFHKRIESLKETNNSANLLLVANWPLLFFVPERVTNDFYMNIRH